MPLYRPPAPDNVHAWLDVATRDLAPSAQARVRAEIESHFADALAAHLAGRLDEMASTAAALADLGSPQAAARRFRQQYLTKREEKSIAARLKMARTRWGLLLFAFSGLAANFSLLLIIFAQEKLFHSVRQISPQAFLPRQLVAFVVAAMAAWAAAHLGLAVTWYRAGRRATTPAVERKVMFLRSLGMYLGSVMIWLALIPLGQIALTVEAAPNPSAWFTNENMAATATRLVNLKTISEAFWLLGVLVVAAGSAFLFMLGRRTYRLQKKIGTLANGPGGNGSNGHQAENSR